MYFRSSIKKINIELIFNAIAVLLKNMETINRQLLEGTINTWTRALLKTVANLNQLV